jgi:poly(A) polymerase
MDQIIPLIIPRSAHAISRSRLSPNALHTLYRLRKHGFTAYLVGGCVRDLLLGREPKDFDVVTNATPGQVKRLFRNCRLVGRRFRLAHLHFADEIVEVATFRAAEPDEPAEEEPLALPVASLAAGAAKVATPPRHLKSEEGVVLRDNVFGTPEEDALRRDFTVNALFYDIGNFSLIDFSEGMADLERGIIRTIGAPEVRFTEDPVRMLRAVRFAAMLGFTIDDATWDALVNLSVTITRAAPPRLYEEILKLLLCGEGEKGYQLLRRSGLFQALFPGFSGWLDRETGGFPHTGMGEALVWTDRRGREGYKVSPQLLFALMFGEYLKGRVEGLQSSGISLQQSLDMTIAGLLEELSVTVLIPQRIGMKMRDILSCQHRFRKTPGKQPHSFISRHCFAEAMEYFHFLCATTGEDLDIHHWWEQFSLGNLPVSSGEMAGHKDAGIPRSPAKRRKRKRRPKKAAGQQSP